MLQWRWKSLFAVIAVVEYFGQMIGDEVLDPLLVVHGKVARSGISAEYSIRHRVQNRVNTRTLNEQIS